jgi:hypothetical protein
VFEAGEVAGVEVGTVGEVAEGVAGLQAESFQFDGKV